MKGSREESQRTLLTGVIMRADRARMCTAFETWRRYGSDRQALIRAQLARILALPGLSRDTTEMVTRILDG